MNKRQAKKERYKKLYFDYGITTWKAQRRLIKDLKRAIAYIDYVYGLKENKYELKRTL